MTHDPDAVLATEPAAPAAESTFVGLGLDDALVATLAELGYEEPTPIQRQAIPPLLEGRDILAEAPTGTGKTAAFALPAIQRISRGDRRDGRARGLVLVPTRELAMQVAEAIHRYGRSAGMRVLPVYGGQAIGQQLRSLRRGVDVVVATPGRAVDHLTRGSLSLDAVEFVVLDEADEMLDMGFAEDLDAVLTAVPATRQTALFSATISPQIARIAKRHLREPARVTVRHEGRERSSANRVRQVAYVVRRADKPTALGRILDLEDPTSALVFARTRGEVEDLAEQLAGHGHDAAALHGGMAQEQRDRVMGRFREGSLDVLVATDVAARGLDIEHVSHVVNYDIPPNPDAYVHRIGRTGRAGREGVAITLVEPREQRLLRNIERSTRTHLELAQIPTVADLRERRLEVLGASLRETLLDDGLDRFRAVVEPLAQEFDIVDVALAAVSLADQATARDGDTAQDLAPARFFDEGPRRPTGAAPPRPGRAPGRPPPRPRREAQPGGGPDRDWVRLFIGAGRRAGMRPADVVGAIANEAGVHGSIIGAIQIADDYTLVEVPASDADAIVAALARGSIRGRKVPVRRDR
jgi:ATP-dependent RNA helicase DeaD